MIENNINSEQNWDDDDLPEWTEDQFRRAALYKKGKLVRPADGTLTKPGRPKLKNPSSRSPCGWTRRWWKGSGPPVPAGKPASTMRCANHLDFDHLSPQPPTSGPAPRPAPWFPASNGAPAGYSERSPCPPCPASRAAGSARSRTAGSANGPPSSSRTRPADPTG